MRHLPGYIIAEKDPDIREAIRESLTKEASTYLTICEQLRFVYDTVEQIEDENIKRDLTEKLIDAFNMGKKMNSRLQRYKRETGSITGSAGSHLIPLDHTADRKYFRSKRV